MMLTTSLLVVGRVTGHQKEQLLLPLFTHQVLSNSSRLHGLQHARLPCPSPSSRVCSNSCPLSRWCHPTILSCHPLLLLPSIFPSITIISDESALCIRWPKCGSFSFSISPSNEYSELVSFKMTGWISLQSKRLSRVFLSTTVQKHQFFCAQPSLWSNSHIYTWLLERP